MSLPAVIWKRIKHVVCGRKLGMEAFKMLNTPKTTSRRWFFIWTVMALWLVFYGLVAADVVEREAAASKQPVVNASCDATVSTQDSVPVNGLQIVLAVDKRVYRPGEQIQLSIRFVNRGNRPFRIFDSHGFWSADIIFQDEDGKEVSRRGGYEFFSPKVNYYWGTTRELAPGGCFEKRLRALVDQRYSVVFGESQCLHTQPLSREARTRLRVPDDIPDDFICTGHIFELKKPGIYRLLYHYEKTEVDRHVWKFINSYPDKNAELLRHVWIGAIDSNQVAIEIKK